MKEDFDMAEWHSITEKPPKIVGDDGYTGYLVYSDGYIQVADYSADRLGDIWFHVDGEYDPDVTHWMLLPAPPDERGF